MIPLPKEEKIQKTLFIFILLFFSFFVYLPALENGFVYDDERQILHNKWITSSSFIGEILTSSVWEFDPELNVKNGYYRPVMHLFYLLEYSLFGANAQAFHFINIVLHAINTVLVFCFILILQKELHYSKRERFASRAFLVALLFCIHPIQSEVVNWIATVPELSYTLFSLLTLSLYFSRKYRFLSYIFFFLAIFSKESAITLLGIFFILFFLSKKEKNVQIKSLFFSWIKKDSIYFSIVFLFLGIRSLIVTSSQPILLENILLSLIRMPENIFFTIEKILFLKELAFLNSYPINEHWTSISFIVFIFIFIAFYTKVRSLKSKHFFLAEKLFPLLAFVILYGVAFLYHVPASYLSERYLYFPFIGIALFASIFLTKKRWLTTLFLFLFIPLSFFLHTQENAKWKNTETLFESFSEEKIQSLDIHSRLTILDEKIRIASLQGDLDSFLIQKQESLRLIEQQLNTYVSSEKAKEILQHSINPMTLYYESYAYFLNNNPQNALSVMQTLPENSIGRKKYIYNKNFALIYYSMNNLSKTEKHLRFMYEKAPRNFITHQTLAHIYCHIGNADKADYYFKRSLEYGNLKERIDFLKKHCSKENDFLETTKKLNLYKIL